MAERSHDNRPAPPRLRQRNAAAAVGEIVEVQGGHIVRSTGRKDRHSKVCTAKGPRDRRVRLAAHTAIQFYDVQDRLGYDRPSKAVDWLIKKAQSAIDELAHLPSWHPSATCSAPNPTFHQDDADLMITDNNNNNNNNNNSNNDNNNNPTGQSSSFLPPSLDSDAIADTIKSFFPVGAPAESSSSSAMEFQSFPTHNLLSRDSSSSNTNYNNQDLKLSLQSFQDPILLHHHNQNPATSQPQILLSGTPLGFDSWPDHHHHQAAELSRFQSGGAAGYLFNFQASAPPPPPPPSLQQLLGQNQFISSQRGPLQSSNTPAVRAWTDPPSSATIPIDHHYQQHPSVLPIYQSSISGYGVGGFSGFRVPARIRGDEEEHDGYTDKPSSASSDSRH